MSTQRDTERALIAKETRELAEEPEEELAELAELYRQKGLSEELARQVAVELTAHDALRSHLDIELGIDPDELTNPWQAAWASMVAFTARRAAAAAHDHCCSPPDLRVAVTLVAVGVALAGTGFLSARIGDAPAASRRAYASWSAALLAMAVTYAIGSLVGVGIA